MFIGRFIVLMIWFILLSFDILLNLCGFINLHRDTSRMTLARSGDRDSRCSILLREASASSTPLVIRLSSASIFVMSLLVSILVLMILFILSDYRIMSCCFTYAWRICLYFITRLISFDCNNLLDSSILFWNFFFNRDIKSTSMNITRWKDGDTRLNVEIPQAHIYLYILGEVKMKCILFGPRWYVFRIFCNPCVHTTESTSLVIDINFAAPPFPDSNCLFASIVNIT